MKTIETRRYEMLVRVRDFGTTHGHLFPESSLARDQFAAVAAAVKDVGDHTVTNMSARQGGRKTKPAAKKALRGLLESMALTARAIGQSTSGFEDKFHLPSSKGDRELLAAGRVFARDAEAFKAQFLAHAMPPTFVADLLAAVQALEQAIHDRDAGRVGLTAARTSSVAAVDTAMVAVRKLDAMVANHLRGDPAARNLWRSIRRLGLQQRRKHAEAPPAPTVAATTPVAEPPAVLPAAIPEARIQSPGLEKAS